MPSPKSNAYTVISPPGADEPEALSEHVSASQTTSSTAIGEDSGAFAVKTLVVEAVAPRSSVTVNVAV